MNSFLVLYKKSSTGKIQQWEIIVEDNLIIVRHGQVDGAIQETTDLIKTGKNIGKSNETTPEEQAQLEAESRYNKQLKKGYVTSIKDAEAGKTDEIIQGGISPMLAHEYGKHKHKLIWPVYVQPKLDGIRCIAMVPKNNGTPTLWTRTRKPITSMPHIIKALKDFSGKDDLILDGELYNHQYQNNFEQIVSLIRPDEPRSGHEIVQYNIYDVVKPYSFEERVKYLDTFLYLDPIKLVETVKCRTETEMRLFYSNFMQQGYEGAIIRNSLTIYEHKRSYGLLKLKDFRDAEFEVIGVEEGRGHLMGCAGSMICKLPNGRAFNVKMTGSHENLRKMFQSPPIGKMMTVKFQNYTNEGVPRFPVGVAIRDYE